MKKQVKVTASVTYIVQDNGFERTTGKALEIVDSDGFRETFVEDIQEAEEYVREIVEEALGLSGGVALGNVIIETTDVE